MSGAKGRQPERPSGDGLTNCDRCTTDSCTSLLPYSPSPLASSVATISKTHPDSISFPPLPRPSYHHHLSPGQPYQLPPWSPRAHSSLPRFYSAHTARGSKSNRDHIRSLPCFKPLNTSQTSAPPTLPIAQMLPPHWPPSPSKFIPTPGHLNTLP